MQMGMIQEAMHVAPPENVQLCPVSSLRKVIDDLHQIPAREESLRVARVPDSYPEFACGIHIITERSSRGQIGYQNFRRAHAPRVELYPSARSPTPDGNGLSAVARVFAFVGHFKVAQVAWHAGEAAIPRSGESARRG